MDDYIGNGKQVLLGRDHIADACSVEYATLIAAALNQYQEDRRPVSDTAQLEIFGMPVVTDRNIPPNEVRISFIPPIGDAEPVIEIPSYPAEELQPIRGHVVRQEGDEFVCITCDPPKRWDVKEGSDHP